MSARSGPRDGPVRGRPRDRDKQLPDPPLRLRSEALSGRRGPARERPASSRPRQTRGSESGAPASPRRTPLVILRTSASAFLQLSGGGGAPRRADSTWKRVTVTAERPGGVRVSVRVSVRMCARARARPCARLCARMCTRASALRMGTLPGSGLRLVFIDSSCLLLVGLLPPGTSRIFFWLAFWKQGRGHGFGISRPSCTPRSPCLRGAAVAWSPSPQAALGPACAAPAGVLWAQLLSVPI